jgi:malate synthase
MTERIHIGGLQVATVLYDLIVNEAIPRAGISAERFWANFENIITVLGSVNKALLAKREDLQHQIDDWHQQHAFDLKSYKNFLQEIGYLVPEGQPFKISTTNVDDEIALIAGPQLVFPVTNARFALKVANARWGSLFDAVHGSDIISESGGCDTVFAAALKC